MKKMNQKSIEYKVYKNITKNGLIKPGDKVIVALSGGPDSVCLFDLMLNFQEKLNFKLMACHYNHRLRGKGSYNDEKFVKKLCEERGIELIVGSAPQKKLFKNEQIAREYRYAFFQKILGESRGAKIATAHNSNDLSETFLMRIIRGTGLKGTLGIPLSRENFIRPLLYTARTDIEDYLKSHGLKYRIDRTNRDIRLTRNYIRLKLLPIIGKINPNILETVANTIGIFEDDYDLLEKLTTESLESIKIKEERQKLILNYEKWRKLHPSLKKSVLRSSILRISGLEDVTNKQILEVCEMLEKGEGNKYKLLPHSLRIELSSGKISIYHKNS